jgi:hypothetical protein
VSSEEKVVIRVSWLEHAGAAMGCLRAFQDRGIFFSPVHGNTRGSGAVRWDGTGTGTCADLPNFANRREIDGKTLRRL